MFYLVMAVVRIMAYRTVLVRDILQARWLEAYSSFLTGITQSKIDAPGLIKAVLIGLIYTDVSIYTFSKYQSSEKP
jgi:hypothetical protein